MTFKELLSLNKNSAVPEQDQVLKRVYRKSRFTAHMMILTLFAAVALVIAIGASMIMAIPDSKKEVIIEGSVNIIESVVAKDKSDLGMSVSSALDITTTEEVSVDELKARLAVTPDIDFQLKTIGNCKYRMEFADDLEENTLYNVLAVYNEDVVYRWAFQTENIFSVTDAYPSNDQHVSADSGIEVTFSHAEVENFESAFKIEPAVEGTFEHYGRTWAFIPDQPMRPATLYTVTIDPQVGGPGGIALKEAYSFSFRTTAEGNYAYMIHRRNEISDTFLVDENPIAAIAYNGFKAEKAKVKVYRLKDDAAFVEAYKSYVRSGFVSSQIMELAQDGKTEFEVTPILAGDYEYNGKTAFVHYPEPLAQGYYFAELTLGDYKVYQLFQSTNLAVYTISSNGSYTAWVNDAITGEAVADAKIYLNKTEETKTNNYGFASFTGPSREDEFRFASIENGNYPYVVVVNGKVPDKEIAIQDQFYTYITTNSSLYKTTDTVGVFGIVLPRKRNGKIPDEITISSAFSKDIVVEPDSSGAFSAELLIENTALSSDTISMVYDGICLDSAWINIADYDLPSYIVNVSLDQNAYTVGDSLRATATVSYPDGTPAPGVTVSGDLNGITDKNGYISSEIFVTENESGSSYQQNMPEVRSVFCEVEEGLGYSVRGSAQYVVFDGDYYLDAQYKDETLEIAVHSFEKKYLETQHNDALYNAVYSGRDYIGAPAGTKLMAEIHCVSYQKEISNSSYDPINKEVYYSWNYTEKDELIETVELTSVDGKINWKIHYSSNENERYYVILKTADSPVESMVRCELYDYSQFTEHFGDGVYCVKAERQEVDIGDGVRLNVYDSDNGEVTTGGSVFYTVVAGEMLDHYYGSTATMEFDFKKEYAPDVEVYGAYFDGKHIYDLGADFIYYKLDNSALNIEFSSDKSQYKPGDEVSASLTVTDRNGDPVSAVLYVSVLDRALYLLNNNADDPLYDLYDRIGYSEVFVTTSYRHFGGEYLPGGEGGGGGGNTRGDFDDTPYYGVIKTNRKGEATFSFKLPDNVTEWKAVVKAFTKDAQGGCSVFDVVSTQDFFTSVVIGEELKTTDDCTIAVKSDGRKINEGEICAYTIGLTDRDGNEIKTEKITALKSEYAYLNFGPLDEGLYTVYVQSACASYSDNVIRSFQVAKTRNTVRINQRMDLQSNLKLSALPIQGNVLLSVADKDYSFWQEAMQRLVANNGPRVDQVLGAYLAENFYVTGEWMDLKKLDLSLLQPYYSGSGLKLFSDSEYDDLRVAAKLAAALPVGCRKDELNNQFSYYLNDRYASRVDVLIAYFGMAALGEPVMADLQEIYSSLNVLTPEETVYLALAFAYGGDYDTAKYLYEQQIKAFIKTADNKAYVEIDGVVEEDLTGAVSILANRLSSDVAEDLIRYILEHDTETTLLSLDLITYLNDYVKDLDGKNIFTLKTATGETKTYSYTRTSILNIELTKDQASEFILNSIEGNSVVMISYVGDLQALSEMTDGISISGVEYEASLKCGAETTIVVPILLTEDFKGATLSMSLPAGLRLANGRVHCGTYGYDISAGYDRDKISVSLQPDAKYIILSVRGSLPGNYVVEPLVISNAVDQRHMMTDPMQITVTE